MRDTFPENDIFRELDDVYREYKMEKAMTVEEYYLQVSHIYVGICLLQGCLQYQVSCLVKDTFCGESALLPVKRDRSGVGPTRGPNFRTPEQNHGSTLRLLRAMCNYPFDMSWTSDC